MGDRVLGFGTPRAMDVVAYSTMGLMIIAAVFIAGLAIERYVRRKIDRKCFSVFMGYALVVLLFGIAMYWHRPFTRYSFLHIMAVIFFIYSGFALLYFRKHSKSIAWTFAAVYLILNLIKIPFPWFYGHSWYAILPFQICSLSGIFIIARPFYTRNLETASGRRKKIARLLDNYLICFGLMGALITVFISGNHTFYQHNGNDAFSGTYWSFFHLWPFEANVLHWLFFTYVIYMVGSREIRMDRKMSLLNWAWITPLYIIFIFTNQIPIFMHNFFYTNSYKSPVQFIWDIFPYWTWNISGSYYIDISPFFWVFMISAGIAFMYLTTVLFEIIDRKLIERCYAGQCSPTNVICSLDGCTPDDHARAETLFDEIETDMQMDKSQELT